MAGLSSVRMSIEDGASGTPMVTAVSDWIELTWSMTWLSFRSVQPAHSSMHSAAATATNTAQRFHASFL